MSDLQTKTQEWLVSIKKFNRHPWPIDMLKTALLVIDMQNYFIADGEEMIRFRDGIVSNVRLLIDLFRTQKRPVIFTRHAHTQDGADLGILKTWWDEMPVDGTVDAEISNKIKPLDGEKVILKNRYSAFFNTDLDEHLKANNINTLVITGVMTNICCESTARDAYFRDYHVKFVADATGTVNEEMHKGTLLNLAYAFADVCTTDKILLGGK